jgi:hypothetical protein
MRTLCLLIAAAISSHAAVTTVRVPNGGIQPQLVQRDGVVHLIYFQGAPENGDLFYVRSTDYGATFSKPLPVNHTPGSAIAVGNIRGAQLAVGRKGRVYVAWNGTAPTGRLPMLFTRLNDSGTAFEPERNLIQKAYGLDGGGTLAADDQGHVYVFWHAPIPGTTGEQNRRVWIAKSANDGAAFDSERVAFDSPVGACGCCGMKASADTNGVYVLFRAADQIVHRDIWMLTSHDSGSTFQGADISRWEIGACVMSAAELTPSADGMLAAWETEKQAYFGFVKNGAVTAPVAAAGKPVNRKFPVLAVNPRGEILFAWTEGMAWKKPGSVQWQTFDKTGHAIAENTAGITGVPVWSVIAAFAKPNGDFAIIY